MHTRRHFITHCLGASAAALALTPMRSRAAAAKIPGAWTFKLKPVSLPIAPGHHVYLSISAGTNVIQEKSTPTSPLTLAAKEVSLSLPASPIPSLSFQTNVYTADGMGSGTNNQIYLQGAPSPYIRTMMDASRTKRVISYRIELKINHPERIVDIELVPHESVSS